VVETNPHLPDIGGPTVDEDLVDVALVVDEPPPVLPANAADEADRTIAARVVDELPAVSTLELGIGGVSKEIGERLVNERSINVWSGLVGETVRPLVETGTAASVVGCMAVGTDPSFYEWLRGQDERIQLESTVTTHSFERLDALPGFVAINSAIEIDLTGQVNAESSGGTYLGGPGGQPEFMRAASSTPDNRAIIAMPASAGSRSRIVPELSGPVTTPRYDVDSVITEHGCAKLDGQSVGDRIASLIDIADPEHRSRLKESHRSTS